MKEIDASIVMDCKLKHRRRGEEDIQISIKSRVFKFYAKQNRYYSCHGKSLLLEKVEAYLTGGKT